MYNACQLYRSYAELSINIPEHLTEILWDKLETKTKKFKEQEIKKKLEKLLHLANPKQHSIPKNSNASIGNGSFTENIQENKKKRNRRGLSLKINGKDYKINKIRKK